MKLRKTTWMMAAVLTVLLVCSCHNGTIQKRHTSETDSMLTELRKSGESERLLAVTDSLEEAGLLNDVKANCHRGYAYYMLEQDRLAEMYFRRAMKGDIRQDASTYKVFSTSMSSMSRLMLIKDEYEECIKIILPILDAWNTDSVNNPLTLRTRTNLSCDLAICYIYQQQPEQGYRIFRQIYDNIEQKCKDDESLYYMLQGIANDARISFKNQGYTQQAYEWSVLEEDIIKKWEQTEDGQTHPDEVKRNYADLYSSRADILLRLKKNKEAQMAFKKFEATEHSKTLSGKLDRISYLENTKQFAAAADLAPYIDTIIAKHGKRLTFDVIRGYLKVKYNVLRRANRTDAALVVADTICKAIDSAVIWQKRDATAELATIYETQEKERTINEQQATLSQQRWIGALVTIALLVVFFTVYTLYRRKATKRLAIAHEELKTAYDQLEETTTAKERIESELRIARDIQMSMVPNIFPDREGLDLFASMHPAKEVGGDLYGYLLQDDELYFCVGDVSGKGVPASLFMAQAIRLFTALAKQHMMPAEMATRLNAELSENNDNGMFVTMFIGKVHLTSGHLDFCNAGHNPPVLGGDAQHGSFLEMEPNVPIGLWPEMKYIGEEIDCIFGRPLFLYTDGLNEAENPQQNQFGDERLLDILQHTHFENARQVIETLENEVHRFRDGADPNDDLTMMCLRVSQPSR